MDKNRIIKELEKRRNKLRARGVKRIGLFGSYLNGSQKRGSDIDLLISFEDIDAANYFGLWIYFENLFRRRVDLIIESDLRPELDHVKKEAIYVKI